MVSNPNFIYYACIAKGTTILAQHMSKEPKIEELAAECLAQAPLHHSMFSHTVRQRTYTFLIDDPFVYFAIFDEELVKSEAFWFLNRTKCAFDEIFEGGSITGSDDFAPLCFQAQFNSIFCETTPLDLDSKNPLRSENKDDQNSSFNSVKGKRSVIAPLLGKPIKRVSRESNGMDGKDSVTENKLDVCDDINGFSGDFALSATKGNDRQKAKQIWKKHVWVVLLLDVFVCATLFVIWLWVCRGFKCMQT